MLSVDLIDVITSKKVRYFSNRVMFANHLQAAEGKGDDTGHTWLAPLEPIEAIEAILPPMSDRLDMVMCQMDIPGPLINNS